MKKKMIPEIPFMKYRWHLLAISMLFVAVALYFWGTRGLNYGADFRGGLTLVYQFRAETDDNKIGDTLKSKSLDGFVVQSFGEKKQNTFAIKVDQSDTAADAKIKDRYTQALQQGYGADQVSLIKEEFVGPKAGKELRTKAVWAIVCAWVIILVYIGFRFDFYFAPGAIVALIHDVLIAVGAFAISGREVNLTVVAAFLTIIGYSINDTIIIFDRIREDLQRYKTMDLISLVNQSINETLTRTLITSATVLFVSVILMLRAEGDIANFGFAMIFGVITGTYSSVFIAAPIFIFLKRHGHRFSWKKSAPPARVNNNKVS